MTAKASSTAAAGFGLSNTGKQRNNNEDQFLIADLGKFLTIRQTTLNAAEQEFIGTNRNARLLMVADGLGGMAGGDVASSLAVRVLTLTAVRLLDWMDPRGEAHTDEIKAELVGAFRKARERLIQSTGKHPEREGMGTTLTTAYLFDERMTVVHVGDSRCYLWRAGAVSRLTTDHTVAERLHEDGAISASAAQRSPFRNVLWNLVASKPDGGGSQLDPEVKTVPVARGDRILLCTDGLTKHVDDVRIAAILGTTDTPDAAAHGLVADALAGGGSDNVTVAVAYV